MLLTLAATGCAAGNGSGDWCATHAMIVLGPGEADRLDQDTVEQLLQHNELGQKLCGWIPPGDEEPADE